jgi:SM-20-related protein
VPYWPSSFCLVLKGDNNTTDEPLFARVANDLETQGYSIHPLALPEDLATVLYEHQQVMDNELFTRAGIGRGDDYLKNKFVRTDEIFWITGESNAGRQWLGWAGALQSFLNHRLFLGLFSFESHFAHYRPRDYYNGFVRIG